MLNHNQNVIDTTIYGDKTIHQSQQNKGNRMLRTGNYSGYSVELESVD